MITQQSLIASMTLALGLSMAQQVSASVTAELVGNDGSDNDNEAPSIAPFYYSPLGAAAGSLTINAGAITGVDGRTIGFSSSGSLLSGATVTVTLTNGAVDSATDSEYYLALIDAGSTSTGAGTIDTVADDVVSGAAVLSSADSVLTFTLTGNVSADTQVVVVRSAGGAGSGHNYSDGDVAQSPTWLIPEDSTQDMTANVASGGQTSLAAAITLPSESSLAMSPSAATETIDVTDTAALGGGYAESAYRYICSTPSDSNTSDSNDFYDTETLPQLSLSLNDSAPADAIVVGQRDAFSDFSVGEASVTATINGPMAPVSSIYWDLDENGTFDNDEAFTINASANTATLMFDPSDSGNASVEASGGNPYVRIVFDGSTDLEFGQYAPSVSLTVDTHTLSVTPKIIDTTSHANAPGALCVIGGLNGARFRPNYLWVRNDDWKQFVRISVDVNAGPSDTGETSWDVYARAKQVTGNDWVRVGTVNAAGELLLWGYQVAQAMIDAGYPNTVGSNPRMDVEFVVNGLGISYAVTVQNQPETAFKLSVVSIQYTRSGGDRVIPVRALVQTASTNDQVSLQ